MSTESGVWEPGNHLAPEAGKLREFVRVMEQTGGEGLADALAKEEVDAGAALMKQEESAWRVAQDLETAELETLVRFFTLAETQLPGWDGGKTSPVIYLVRILRARDAFPAELRKWIKANTENRYLPYGSAL